MDWQLGRLSSPCYHVKDFPTIRSCYQVLIHSRAIQTFLRAYLMKKRCPRIIRGDFAKYVWTEPQTARKLLRLDILPSHSAGLYTTPPHGSKNFYIAVSFNQLQSLQSLQSLQGAQKGTVPQDPNIRSVSFVLRLKSD